MVNTKLIDIQIIPDIYLIPWIWIKLASWFIVLETKRWLDKPRTLHLGVTP